MKGMKIYVNIILLVLYGFSCSVNCFQDARWQDLKDEESSLVKVVLECIRKDDVGLCLKWKTARALDRLLRTTDALPITDYVSLIRKSKTEKTSDEDLAEMKRSIESNPRTSNEDENEKLNEIIWNKVVSLLNTRTIQISVPSESFEGRKKIEKVFKKGHGMLMMAGMMGGMMMKMAMAKVALIAGKALIVAKIALVLALIIGLKKLVSSKDGDGHSEVVYASAEHGGGGWQRSFGYDTYRAGDGADLAYNAYSNLKSNQM